MIGKTISHYKIFEKLGGGGMGMVYKAEDTKLKRIVALKFLHPTLSFDEEAKQRFIHEAQAASSLQHNNICTIHEIDETDDGQMFIVMDFYDGDILRSSITSGPLPVEHTLEIAIQVANGLAKAHEKGITHRDIKPANIIVTRDGVAKILDFGLVKLVGETTLTKAGTTLGTIAYMSPEQIRGEKVDHRSDIWAFGVVLYEMLSGQPPFRGEYEQARMYSIVSENPEPPSEVNKDIPDELEQIIFKCLSKDPRERYQSATELLRDLQLIQKSLSGESTEAISAPVIPHKRKRNSIRLIVTAVIATIFIAVLIWIFYPSRTIAFGERDWILITDFENLTNEDIFDKSLNTALSVSIGQSSYINIYPRRRIDETLRRMEKANISRIDEALGREIALREGINIMVVPGISQVGDSYVLTGILEDSRDGGILASEIVRAKNRHNILSALDKLSNKIRRDLGESLTAIQDRSKPLIQVTTSSLEALKQYSLGIEAHWKADLTEARLYYENALKIDSSFTAAKASLGILEFERIDRENGKRLIAEAIKNLDNLTEKEKLGILAFHANAVEHNLNKAANYMKSLIAIYPDHYPAYNNLGWYYNQMGRFREAIAAYKKALQLNPYLMFTYNGMNWIYLNELGEVDSALAWCKKQISYEPDNPWGYDYTGWAYLGKDSLFKAEKAFKKAIELNPAFILDLYRLAHTYRLLGRYNEAIEPLEKILQIDSTEISAHYNLGLIYSHLNLPKLSHQHYKIYQKFTEKQARENPEDIFNQYSLAVLLTRLGEKERGWQVARKAIRTDSTEHFRCALYYSVAGKTKKAIHQLKLNIQNGDHNYIWFKIHPDFEPLYANAEFREMIRQGLKQ